MKKGLHNFQKFFVLFVAFSVIWFFKKTFLASLFNLTLSPIVIFSLVALLHSGYHQEYSQNNFVIIHSTKSELRFRTGLYPACRVLEICDGENL